MTTHLRYISHLMVGAVLLAGCAGEHRRREVIVIHDGEPRDTVIVHEAPPPNRVEVIGVAPSHEHVWVGGHWVWRHGWEWMPGHWERRTNVGAEWNSRALGRRPS